MIRYSFFDINLINIHVWFAYLYFRHSFLQWSWWYMTCLDSQLFQLYRWDFLHIDISKTDNLQNGVNKFPDKLGLILEPFTVAALYKVTELRYCCQASAFHWFCAVISSIMVHDSKTWSSRLWRNTSLENYSKAQWMGRSLHITLYRHWQASYSLTAFMLVHWLQVQALAQTPVPNCDMQ